MSHQGDKKLKVRAVGIGEGCTINGTVTGLEVKGLEINVGGRKVELDSSSGDEDSGDERARNALKHFMDGANLDVEVVGIGKGTVVNGDVRNNRVIGVQYVDSHTITKGGRRNKKRHGNRTVVEDPAGNIHVKAVGVEGNGNTVNVRGHMEVYGITSRTHNDNTVEDEY